MEGVHSNRGPIRVALADSCPALLAGLDGLLRASGIEVVGLATTTAQALALIDRCRPRVVVLDVNLPDHGGIAACRDIVETFPRTAVLLLSHVDEDVYLAESWMAGAAGFLLERATKEQFRSAIRLASEGRPVHTPQQRGRIRHWQRTVQRYLDELSGREREVLGYIVMGVSNRGIAEALVLSENTVEKHVSSILGKFEVHSRAQLISFCLRHRVELSMALDLGGGGEQAGVEDGLALAAGR